MIGYLPYGFFDTLKHLYVKIKFFLIGIAIFFSAASGDQEPTSKLTIKVKPNIWGGAKAVDVQKVLESAANQLTPYIWQKNLKPIQVERSQTGPIVLYRRGNNGEYLVRLNTQKTFWCQYAFQFAHELGHIICGYKKGNSSNSWFEESICETASLFVLKNMTKEWKKKPPYANWKPYALEFEKYANNRLKKHPWPSNQSVSFWYNKHKILLEKNPVNREKNTTIATRFLEFFNQNPKGWETCAFINKQKSDKKRSFKNYLFDWRNACQTSDQKQFVSKFIESFGFEE